MCRKTNTSPGYKNVRNFWPITERNSNQYKKYFVNAKDLKPANIMYSIAHTYNVR